jgi:hypothetical protein
MNTKRSYSSRRQQTARRFDLSAAAAAVEVHCWKGQRPLHTCVMSIRRLCGSRRQQTARHCKWSSSAAAARRAGLAGAEAAARRQKVVQQSPTALRTPLSGQGSCSCIHSRCSAERQAAGGAAVEGARHKALGASLGCCSSSCSSNGSCRQPGSELRGNM